MSRAEFIFYIFGNLLFTATIYFIAWGENPAEWGVFWRMITVFMWLGLNLFLALCAIDVRRDDKKMKELKIG